MKMDANDPRWTAYALGEIADEKERAEIEGILAESPEMRRLVEEIRETAGLLREDLRAEPVLPLTQAQHEKIESRAGAGRSWLMRKPVWILAGAAAALLLAFSVIVRHPGRQETAELRQKSNPVMTAEVKEPARIQDLSGQLREKAPSSEPAQSASASMDVKTNERHTPDPAVSKDRNETSVAPQGTGASAEIGRRAEAERAKGEEYKAKADAMLAAAVPAPEGQKKQPENVIAGELSEERKSLPEALTAAAQTSSAQRQPPGPNAPSQTRVKGLAAGVVAGSLMSSVGGASAGESMPPRPRRRPWDGPPPTPRQRGSFNTETYDYISDNPFLDAAQNPLSTFSIDVDTASYSNVRRFLESGKLPPKDAVRVEELVNYFDYDYKGPKDEKPFAVDFELTEAPWKPEHKLLRIGLKGREISPGKRPAGNLVFLLDVSGSMADENKLPLVKESMRLLVDQLTESDRVAIVVYAGDTSLILPSTSGDQKEKIRRAIDCLRAGGSTNGASGIQLAYKTARENFMKGGTNRVILATDGDFNVGVSNRGDLTRLIEDQTKSGIYLSALGFGMGNYKDATLELLANKGRGNYAYIDTLREAKKVLVEQMNATLITIAKDVKIQVEFNPRRVSSYRLIGYEDRMMPKEDFNDDDKTAGAVGAGHSVTALYELVPAAAAASAPSVDPLKYQKPAQPSASAESNEILTVKIRSKEPEKDKSILSEFAVKDSAEKFSRASQDFKFAAAVAAFGMVLRDSPHKGSSNLESVLEWAKEGRGTDSQGYRQEFIRLVHRAISISF